MLESIDNFLNEYPILSEVFKFAGIILLAAISYFVTKKIIVTLVRSFVKKSNAKYDDILLNEKILTKIAIVVPIIVVNQFTYLAPGIAGFCGRESWSAPAHRPVHVAGPG